MIGLSAPLARPLVTYSTATFRRTSLETLVDSPVYAGKHFTQVDLDPGSSVPVHLNLFADRQDTGAFPVQPFDAGAADDSEFALTLDGRLRERSFTWGFTQEIVLDDAGNGVLTGWGESIGNTGVPSFWAIAFGPLLAIPQ